MQSNRWEAATKSRQLTVQGGANYNEDKHETDYNNTGTNRGDPVQRGCRFPARRGWYIGAQLGRADNEMDFGASASRYEMQSLDITLLGGFHSGPWFCRGRNKLAATWTTTIENAASTWGPVMRRTESADTSGEALGIMLTAGLNMVDADKDFPCFGPTWSAKSILMRRWTATKKKSGDATAIQVTDMKTTSGIGSAGIFGDMQLGFCACSIYSELTYRAYFRQRRDQPAHRPGISAGQLSKLPGYKQDDDSIRWEAGMAAKLGRAMGSTWAAA